LRHTFDYIKTYSRRFGYEKKDLFGSFDEADLELAEATLKLLP
jgi:hypothetical protein